MPLETQGGADRRSPDHHLLGPLIQFAALFRIAPTWKARSNAPRTTPPLTPALLATWRRPAPLPPPLSAPALRLIGCAARLATPTPTLSARSRSTTACAGGLALAAGAAHRCEHVDAAIAAHRHRHERIRLSRLDQILRGRWLIDTAGNHVGQIQWPGGGAARRDSFAHPQRITARCAPAPARSSTSSARSSSAGRSTQGRADPVRLLPRHASAGCCRSRSGEPGVRAVLRWRRGRQRLARRAGGPARRAWR